MKTKVICILRTVIMTVTMSARTLTIKRALVGISCNRGGALAIEFGQFNLGVI